VAEGRSALNMYFVCAAQVRCGTFAFKRSSSGDRFKAKFTVSGCEGGDSIKPPVDPLRLLKDFVFCIFIYMTDSQTRASWWIITINNPTEEDYANVRNLPAFVRYVKGQDEISESGTLHIQAVCNTSQVRMSQLKGWLPRAHFDILKSKTHQKNSLQYVWKDETAVPNTRFEAGAVIEKAKTFDDILYDIATYLVDNPEGMFSVDRMELDLWNGLSYDKCIEKEFARSVNEILKEDLALASLLVRPDLFRAWKLFRETFIQQVRLDRQTTVKISE